MEKEYYIIQMEKLNMKEILLMVNMKEMENILGKMVNIISDNGKMIYNMEKEQNIIQMEKLNMKEILLMINMKEMENIVLKKEIIILVNLKMV